MFKTTNQNTSKRRHGKFLFESMRACQASSQINTLIFSADTGPGHGQPMAAWPVAEMLELHVTTSGWILRQAAKVCSLHEGFDDLMVLRHTEGLKIGYPIHWLIILFRHHFGGRQRISRQSQWVFWNHLEPNNCAHGCLEPSRPHGCMDTLQVGGAMCQQTVESDNVGGQAPGVVQH